MSEPHAPKLDRSDTAAAAVGDPALTSGQRFAAAELVRALDEIARLQEQVAALQSEAASERSAWKGWFAAAGTASVTLLAFLIPSVQEQWDRIQQRAAIEDYREIAHELMHAGKYHEAEQTFARALELSDEPRLDIERERLVAKTDEVNADPAWGGQIDAALEESDFLVLETMQAHAHDVLAQSWTLNNHAVFLANHGAAKRARPVIERAIALVPSDARLRVTLGNVLWDLDDSDGAQQAFTAALQRAPDNVSAHYNLALLFEERGDELAATQQLRSVLSLNPQDVARQDLERITGKHES